MEQQPLFSGWMRWLTPGEGGRTNPHPGGRYAATAYPDSGTIADLRSIVFDDVPPGPGEGAVEARWLAQADSPARGTNLIITEGPRPVAILEVQSAAAPAIAQSWTFRVTSSFTITGHGTGAVGTLSGTIGHGRQPAALHTRQHTAVPVTISLQYARAGGSDQPALLVHDIDKGQVPPGAILRPPAAQPNL